MPNNVRDARVSQPSNLETNQPLKVLYLSYEIASTLFVRLPWWILRSISRSWRPRQSWDLGRVLQVKTLRRVIYINSQVGTMGPRLPDHRAVESDVGEYGVWVEAAPDLINDELQAWADVASVEPIRIPGYWMHKDGSDIKVASPPVPGEKIYYHLHGGGYTHVSAHPSQVPSSIPLGILQLAKPVQRAFNIEYRLSSTEPFPVANPFPAALLDALAGYNYLVNVVGFSPSDIIVSGDSAGGNLAHALVRYLVENQNSVKVPAPPEALILVSPWSDMSPSHNTPESLPPVYQDCDILVYDDVNSYAKSAFLGPHGERAAETNRYISPACKTLNTDFKGFPRTFIIGGGLEFLIDQIRTLKEKMIKDLGEDDGVRANEGKVRYIEEPEAVHDYLMFKWHEPERTRTLKEVVNWITVDNLEVV